MGKRTLRWIRATTIAIAVGCGGSTPPRAPAPPAPPALGAIADAEAARAGGTATLIRLAREGSADPRDAKVAVRALAVRGLGRVGTAEAIAALRALLREDRALSSSAAAALGVAAALGEVDPAVTEDLIAAAQEAATTGKRAIVLEALGRAGDARALAALVPALADPDPVVAAAAGIALGRMGRRELGLDDAARAALVTATARPDRDVRHAATYALAREHRGKDAAAAPAVEAALLARTGDEDAEIRALAVGALGKRGEAPPPVLEALLDIDWRVAVQAVRATLAAGGDAGRDALAIHMLREWTRLMAATPGASPHPLLESLRGLKAHAGRQAVRSALARIAAGAGAAAGPKGRPAVDALTAGWVHCLALAALARPVSDAARADEPTPATAFAGMSTCGAGLPAHLRMQLVAEAIGDGAGGDRAARSAALAGLLADRDGRVVAAALAVLPPLWPELVGDARAAAVTAIVDRLGAADAGVVSAAALAAAALLARADIGAVRGQLAAPLVARAARPSSDPELAATLLTALADAKIAEGQKVCETAVGDASPAVAAAARRCLKALTGSEPAVAATVTPPARPPVDVARALGQRFTWTVDTSRGRVVIELDGSIAPWHVAAIVELTQRQFYDGLIFHRVVPDFVVQGGDPAGAGWGGPGFTLPSEPAGEQATGTGGFARGAVGIADGGKGSGGSQWFVMHSRAAHLEGRYTHIGRVVTGLDVIDMIIVGDRIVRARVEARRE